MAGRLCQNCSLKLCFYAFKVQPFYGKLHVRVEAGFNFSVCGYANSVAASAIDGLAQGVGYTIVLVLMCIIREFFGNGTFGGGILGIEGAGIRILPTEYTTLFIILPFGGFLVMGVLIAAMQHISNKADEKRKEEK